MTSSNDFGGSLACELDYCGRGLTPCLTCGEEPDINTNGLQTSISCCDHEVTVNKNPADDDEYDFESMHCDRDTEFDALQSAMARWDKLMKETEEEK